MNVLIGCGLLQLPDLPSAGDLHFITFVCVDGT
jgi:hypothetical protein